MSWGSSTPPALLRCAENALDRGLDAVQAAQEVVRLARCSRAAADYSVQEAQLAHAAQKAPKGVVDRSRKAAAARTVEAEADRLEDGRQRSLDRLVVQGRAREESFLKALEQVAQRSFAGKIQVKAPNWARRKAPVDRAVNLVLSDLHFGSDLDPKEVPQAYGPQEEARRLAWVVQQTAEYKPQYRDRTKLLVHILGDIVQNQLHDARDGVPLAQQACAAISYLSQALAYLSACYKRIEVRCVPGNHGRFTSRHHGRAIHQKWDSLETVVYFGVREALKHLSNVQFELFKTPYYVWECFSEYGFATHGDTVLHPGSPSKSINVSGLEAQVHDLNDDFRSTKKPCTVFLHGHAHRGWWTELDTGETIVGNGMLVPSDSFAVSMGKLKAACGQMLMESVPGHLAGDIRKIRVGTLQDRDATLDKIVRPFWGIDGHG